MSNCKRSTSVHMVLMDYLSIWLVHISLQHCDLSEYEEKYVVKC